MIRTLNTSAHDLRDVATGSVHAIMTSPPYYGLRSYAGDQDVEWSTVTYRLNEWTEPLTVDAWRGPLGLEPSPVAYIGHLILCLREWGRVLRDDGVCFVNLGDSYHGGKGKNGTSKALGNADERGYKQSRGTVVMDMRPTDSTDGPIKPKDLLGIPWMFAFAARADGWYLRSDIIWHKPNPMPESVTDRPTKAHEYVFMLAKAARYYFDADAVREESATEPHAPGNKADNGRLTASMGHVEEPERVWAASGRRNIRTVWSIATAPYPGAHYAVWPERLVEPMIKAATSERGVCPTCGAQWRRVVERTNGDRLDTMNPSREAIGHERIPRGHSSHQPGWRKLEPDAITTAGWSPSCDCYPRGEDVPECFEPLVEPATVLDPFAGSGTTGRVAVRLGRRAILCDVSAEYLSEHVPARTTVQMEMMA